MRHLSSTSHTRPTSSSFIPAHQTHHTNALADESMHAATIVKVTNDSQGTRVKNEEGAGGKNGNRAAELHAKEREGPGEHSSVNQSILPLPTMTSRLRFESANNEISDW